jgi:hypothetical protein
MFQQFEPYYEVDKHETENNSILQVQNIQNH